MAVHLNAFSPELHVPVPLLVRHPHDEVGSEGIVVQVEGDSLSSGEQANTTNAAR